MPRKKATAAVEAPEAPAVNEGEGPVVLKLVIPRDLYAEYEEAAQKQDLTTAELIVHRLQRCKTHSSIRSAYFSTSQLARLEQILQKRPIEDAEHALALIKTAMSVRIDSFDPVPISHMQAKRIHLGAFGGQTPYDRLCYIVQGAIAKATGT